jgi:hypothetical protein
VSVTASIVRSPPPWPPTEAIRRSIVARPTSKELDVTVRVLREDLLLTVVQIISVWDLSSGNDKRL